MTTPFTPATLDGRGDLATAGATAGAAVRPILLEFESPTAALLAHPVPLRSRFTVWVIAALIAVLLVVAFTMPIDRVVTSAGRVTPAVANLVVQPLDTAIVRAILVHEGERVTKGQVLARLDPTFAAADERAAAQQAASLGAEVTRLQDELAGRSYVSDGTKPSQLEALIFAQRQATYTYKVETYRQKIDSLRARVAQAAADVASYTGRLRLATETERMRAQLQRLNVGSRLNTLAAQDNRIEMARFLATARTSLDGAKRDLDAMIAERDGYIQQWHADTSQMLTTQQRKLDAARQQLQKDQLRRHLVELRAPQDAIVLSIAPVNVGSVLQTGDQFFTLVPINAPLQVETLVAGSEAGFVSPGVPVTIKFNTFPYVIYGSAKGRVISVSADSFNSQQAFQRAVQTGRLSPASSATTQLSQTAFYRLRISIDAMNLRHLPPDFHLTPGMPVTADIKIGTRTFIQYMLARVIPPTTTGMREP